MLPLSVAAAVLVLLVLSLAAAPRAVTVDGFFAGRDAQGRAPGLWMLVLSQVTTWIFARSLMNAAILGYYYGIAGVLAYTAYYGSFLTGAAIVGALRRAGAGSVQDWLGARFGRLGTVSYNAVIALRLLSEVFANLLVVGLIAAAVLPQAAHAQEMAILGVAALALAYSARGGLRAALRTDVVQMLLFLAVFGLAFAALVTGPDFHLRAVLTAPGISGPQNGWILLAVAALQVFSYPAHDPVMMDRGFLADARTTRASFLHAAWISALCIFAFGLFGVQAGLLGVAYEGQLIGTWAAMFPLPVYLALLVALIVSALSTLDSALSSAARLAVTSFGVPRSLAGGRVAMAGFAVAGTALTLIGTPALFDAVAVSGTASMFLTPVLAVGLFAGRPVPRWAFAVAFAAAMAGAAAYYFRAVPMVAAILPEGHKYLQLLGICAVVLAVGTGAVLIGMIRHDTRGGIAKPRPGC